MPVNQQYMVTGPYAEYDPPVFEANSGCPQILSYTNSVSANTWITGFTDNGGLGKIVGWQTDEYANIAQYTVTITASNQCSTG